MSTIIFVYNTDSGFISTMADMTHRLLAPESYQCRLSMITGFAWGPTRRWKRFLHSLDRPVEFLRRNELRRSYAIDHVPLPAMFLRDKGQMHLALAADAINRCRTLEELEELVRSLVREQR
jgi:hypothetical protein